MASIKGIAAFTLNILISLSLILNTVGQPVRLVQAANQPIKQVVSAPKALDTGKLAAIVDKVFAQLNRPKQTNALPAPQALATPPIIPLGSSGWRYQVAQHDNLPASYEQPGFDDSRWTTGEGGFGSAGFGCPLEPNIHTPWPVNTDIALRKYFNLPDGVQAVHVEVPIDDLAQVFINGHELTNGLSMGEAGGCAQYIDLGVGIFPKFLQPADNLLAIRGWDNGVVNYVDAQVVAYGPKTYVGGVITQNTTWTAADSPVLILDNLTIPSGVTLTVQAGVIIKLERTKRITINGAFITQGSADQPIYITSIRDDSIGGDSNGDGGTTTPARGDWDALRVVGGQIALTYVQLSYGNFGVVSDGSNDSKVGLHQSTLRENSSDGIRVNGGEAVITDSTINENGGHAIGGESGQITATGNTLRDNNRSGIYINNVTLIAQSNTIQGNLGHGMEIYGTSTVNLTGNIVTANQGTGLILAIVPNQTAPVVSNNTFRQNGSYGVELRPYGNLDGTALNTNTFQNNPSGAILINYQNGAGLPVLTDNIFTGNGINDGLRLTGTIGASMTLPKASPAGLAYVISPLTIAAEGIVTVEPGVVVKMDLGTWLEVRGRLIAQGTQANPITFSSIRDDSLGGDTNEDGDTTQPARGNWNSISLSDDNGRMFLDYVHIRYGGNPALNAWAGTLELRHSLIEESSGTGVVVGVRTGQPIPIIAENTIRQGGGIGLELQPNTDLAQVNIQNNIITGFAQGALRINYQGGMGFPVLTGNTLTGNLFNHSVILSGTLGNKMLLPLVSPIGMDYVVQGLTIGSGAELTIEPGVVVKMDLGASLDTRGRLIGKGTQANPITFTSIRDDSLGGDTNEDGNATQPERGNWGSLILSDDNGRMLLDYVHIRYGGNPALNAWAGALDLRHSLIEESGGTGLVVGVRAGQPIPVVAGNTIRQGNGIGLELQPNTDLSQVNIQGNTITFFAQEALRVNYQGGSGLPTLTGNTFTDNALNHSVTLAGTLSSNMTLPTSYPLTYVIENWMTPDGVTLTLNPGVVLKMKDGSWFGVHGILKASGTPQNPIVFTSLKDDSVGGDTNEDGSTSQPAPGDWAHIGLNQNGQATIEHAMIRYGGRAWWGDMSSSLLTWSAGNQMTVRNVLISDSSTHGMAIGNGNVTVTDSAFQKNQGQGVVVYNGTMNITNSSLSENVAGGLLNESGSQIEATRNWWGHPSGPYHPTTNPQAAGNQVSDTVNYTPWLITPPGSAPRQAVPLALNQAVTATIMPLDYVDYTLKVPAALSLLVEVTPACAQDGLMVFSHLGALPYWNQNDQFVDHLTPRNTYELGIYPTQEGTYYLSVYGRNISCGGQFQIVVREVNRHFSNLSPRSGGNAGDITINVAGLGFVKGMKVTLSPQTGDDSLSANQILLTSPMELLAHFSLNGAVIGDYTVNLLWPDGHIEKINNVFVITQGHGAHLETKLIVPPTGRVGRRYIIWIECTNTGDSEMSSPLFNVKGPSNTPLSLVPNDPTNREMIQVLGIDPHGIPGQLEPGVSVRIPIYMQIPPDRPGHDIMHYELGFINTSNEMMDWDKMEVVKQPSDISTEAWHITWTALVNNIGPTVKNYIDQLRKDAKLLPIGMGSVYSVSDIFQISIERAKAQTLRSIAGHLKDDSTGSDVQGVRLTLTNLNGLPITSGWTLNDGTFVITNIPTGTFTLSAEGYLPTDGMIVLTVPDNGLHNLELSMQRGGSISGTARSSLTGKSVGGVDIIAQNQNGEMYLSTSSLDGSFKVTSLPSGTYNLSTRSNIYTTTLISGVQVETSQQVLLYSPLELETGASISGEVMLSGDPTTVTTYVVEVSSPQWATSGEFLTNTAFSIGGLISGTYKVHIYAAGYDAQVIDSIQVVAGQMIKLPVVNLGIGGGIQGLVKQAGTDQPVVNGAIKITGSGQVWNSTGTSQDGTYVIENLVPGTYTLQVSAPGYWSMDQDITIVSGKSIPVTTLLHKSGSIQGMVIDTLSNQGLQGIAVQVSSDGGILYNAITDVSGHYLISNLPIENYWVSVGNLRFSGLSQTRVILDGNNPDPIVNFDFSVAGFISGTVYEADGVTPMVGAVVSLGQDGHVILFATSDKDGKYGFAVLQSGVYQAEATSLIHSFNVQSNLSISNGIRLSGKDFVAAELSVSGTAFDSNTGKPIPGSYISVVAISTIALVPKIGSSLVNADGSFVVSGLRGGHFKAIASAPGYIPNFVEVTLQAGQNLPPIAFLLTPGATLSGVVVEAATDIPVINSYVIATPLVGEKQDLVGITDNNGRYKINGLAVGTYFISVVDNIHEVFTTTVNITPDGLVQDFALVASSTQISGRILDGRANPVSGADITVLTENGQELVLVSSNIDGVYQINGLIPGTYSLHIKALGYVIHFSSITIAKGNNLNNAIIISSCAIGFWNKSQFIDLNLPDYFLLLPQNINIISQTQTPNLFKDCGVLGQQCDDCIDKYHEMKKAEEEWIKAHNEYLKIRNTYIAKTLSALVVVEMIAGTIYGGIVLVEWLVPLIGQTVGANEIQKMVLDIGLSSLYTKLLALPRLLYDEKPDEAKALYKQAWSDIKGMSAELAITIEVANKKGLAKIFNGLFMLMNIIEQATTLLEGTGLIKAIDDLVDLGMKLKYAKDNELKRENEYKEAAKKYFDCYQKLRGSNLYCCQNPNASECKCAGCDGPTQPGGGGDTDPIAPGDPNEKIGPAGYGNQRTVLPGESLSYRIHAENRPTASAPAQEVVIRDIFDTKLDFHTFQFTEFAFGDQIISVQPNNFGQFYTRLTIPDYRSDVQKKWWLDVSVSVSEQTGRVDWIFRTLDPETGDLPEDPLAGFLPPNDGTGRGEMHVSFTIYPKTNIPLGTRITNQANIVFDTNEAISTNEVWNTIDLYHTYLPLVKTGR